MKAYLMENKQVDDEDHKDPRTYLLIFIISSLELLQGTSDINPMSNKMRLSHIDQAIWS